MQRLGGLSRLDYAYTKMRKRKKHKKGNELKYAERRKNEDQSCHLNEGPRLLNYKSLGKLVEHYPQA